MAPGTRETGARIEELLVGLRDREVAEELVRLLMEMYGEGLTRIVALLDSHDPTLVHRLCDDDLVSGLLVLHDLHPLDVDTRIQRALDRIRPYLGSHAGGVEYLGVGADGVARLALQGNCNGCPSSLATVQNAIEGAIQDAAPEVDGVEVTGVTTPGPLLQVGMRPPPEWTAGCPVPEEEAARP
ncbi:MAG TPA: NifU family protein [Actinophytocola sp.]|uniref:NifU family protein n=1 Tax=Actinophytocola sp. TaxID=1872138 RepID=UPI002DB73025|nr:NifU family protein [Actinophytocola sp.]HEU5471486.1 NifU family protein [Actinophytocola sp.]